MNVLQTNQPTTQLTDQPILQSIHQMTKKTTKTGLDQTIERLGQVKDQEEDHRAVQLEELSLQIQKHHQSKINLSKM